ATSRPVKRSSLVATGRTRARLPPFSSTAWSTRSTRQCRPPKTIVTVSRSARVNGLGEYARYGSVVAVDIAPSVAALLCFHVPVHPRLEQFDGIKARQSADGVVDLAGGGASIGAAEEVRGEEAELAVRLDPAPDGRPEPVYEKPRDPGDLRALESDLGL